MFWWSKSLLILQSFQVKKKSALSKLVRGVTPDVLGDIPLREKLTEKFLLLMLGRFK
jgi:hypothetical protein